VPYQSGSLNAWLVLKQVTFLGVEIETWLLWEIWLILEVLWYS